MPQGIRLGRMFGIPIRVDWSVVAIFAFLTWSLAAEGYPDLASGYPTAVYWIAGAATAVLFFLSLLAHELSHSVVARKKGIAVRDITLWLFGGVSVIEGEAHTPHDELQIAIAGPATSFAIAVGGIAAAWIAELAHLPHLLVVCGLWLGSINAVLAIFNLAPAAPLDGGRVLHAWLWRRRGDRISAGISAARAGRVFGWLLVGLGFVEVMYGAIGGLWFMLLGWFVLAAARSEGMQTEVTRDLDGVRVRDVMTADPVTVADDLTVEGILNEYLFRHHCSAFPTTGPLGNVTGLVTLSRVRSVPAWERDRMRACDVAWPIDEVTTAAPDELLLEVLRRAQPAGDSRILVFSEGRLVGIVSSTDVARAIQDAELALSR